MAPRCKTKGGSLSALPRAARWTLELRGCLSVKRDMFTSPTLLMGTAFRKRCLYCGCLDRPKFSSAMHARFASCVGFVCHKTSVVQVLERMHNVVSSCDTRVHRNACPRSFQGHDLSMKIRAFFEREGGTQVIDVARRYFNDGEGLKILERIAHNTVDRHVGALFLPLSAFCALIQYAEMYASFQYHAKSVKVIMQQTDGRFMCRPVVGVPVSDTLHCQRSCFASSVCLLTCVWRSHLA